METNAGIWIDRSHAIVIVVTDGVEVTKSFIVAKRNAFRPSTESRQEHDYTRNDFVAEDRLERKQDERRRKMYEAIFDYLPQIDSLFIFGPGEAKTEFRTFIQAKEKHDFQVDMETADKLTGPECLAKVREHFDRQRPKSVAK